MKVITLQIDDKLYEDFKSFKNLYAMHIVRTTSCSSSHQHSEASSHPGRIPWHEITLNELQSRRPDLIREIFEVRGSWGATLYDVVTAIESNQAVIQLKQESPKEWLARHQPKPGGCVLAAIALASVAIGGTILGLVAVISIF
jgi:hypothetical protein